MCKSDNTRKVLLKQQINIRVKGYGWVQFTKAFSKKGDSSVGTVADLTAWVNKIICKEAVLVVPSEAHIPCPKRKSNPVIGGITKQREDMESGTGGNRFAPIIKGAWEEALEQAKGDHDVARAILLGAPVMDESMVGMWIAYKFDEEGWWAGQVKRVSMADGEAAADDPQADGEAAGSAAGGSRGSAGGVVLTKIELESCTVQPLRDELSRLQLDISGVKRLLVERLLLAQSAGKELAVKPKAKKKAAARPKKASATRDINTVPRQAGWAWIEFGDGEANWFHLRASHFGDEVKDQERRGAWRRALTTDQGMGRQWKDGVEVDGASAAGAAGAAGTTGGNAADPGEMEVEEAEAGPDDERVEAAAGSDPLSSSDEDGAGGDSGGDGDEWMPGT